MQGVEDLPSPVREKHGTLTWNVGRTQWWWLFIGAMFSILVLLLGHGFSEAQMAFIPAIFLLAGGIGLSLSPRRVSVSREGVKTGFAALDSARVVRVTGSPGGKVRVVACAEREWLLLDVPGHHSLRWTVDGITALVQVLADRLGAEVQDERDLTAWRAWAHERQERARAAYHRSLAQSQAKSGHAVHYPTEQTEPKADITLQRAVYRVSGLLEKVKAIELTRSHLVVGENKLALHSIEHVAVEVRSVGHGDGHAYAILVLRVFANGTSFDVLKRDVARTPAAGAEMSWLADTLRSAAAAAVPQETGSRQDIPEELRQMVQPVES